jgi:hypothetical protein
MIVFQWRNKEKGIMWYIEVYGENKKLFYTKLFKVPEDTDISDVQAQLLSDLHTLTSKKQNGGSEGRSSDSYRCCYLVLAGCRCCITMVYQRTK